MQPDYIVPLDYSKDRLESARKWAVAFGKKILEFTDVERRQRDLTKEKDKRVRHRRNNSKWNIRNINKKESS